MLPILCKKTRNILTDVVKMVEEKEFVRTIDIPDRSNLRIIGTSGRVPIVANKFTIKLANWTRITQDAEQYFLERDMTIILEGVEFEGDIGAMEFPSEARPFGSKLASLLNRFLGTKFSPLSYRTIEYLDEEKKVELIFELTGMDLEESVKISPVNKVTSGYSGQAPSRTGLSGSDWGQLTRGHPWLLPWMPFSIYLELNEQLPSDFKTYTLKMQRLYLKNNPTHWGLLTYGQYAVLVAIDVLQEHILPELQSEIFSYL